MNEKMVGYGVLISFVVAMITALVVYFDGIFDFGLNYEQRSIFIILMCGSFLVLWFFLLVPIKY